MARMQCPECDGRNTIDHICYRCGGTGWVDENNGCFPAGTLIETSAGSIDIACVTNTDHVLAFDPMQNALRSRRVIAVRKYQKRRIWQITLANENQIRVTSVHSFLVAGGWKQTRKLIVGDLVSCIDELGNMSTHTVAKVEATSEIEDVFNLIVDGDFSFVASGAIVHSFTYCRRLRMMVWSVYSGIKNVLEGNRRKVADSARPLGFDV